MYVTCDLDLEAWWYHGWFEDSPQLRISGKRFLSPRRMSNPQRPDDRWDALTNELPRLRRGAKVQIRRIYMHGRPIYVVIWSLTAFSLLSVILNLSYILIKQSTIWKPGERISHSAEKRGDDGEPPGDIYEYISRKSYTSFKFVIRNLL